MPQTEDIDETAPSRLQPTELVVEFFGADLLPLAKFCVSKEKDRPLLTIVYADVLYFSLVTISAVSKDTITFMEGAKKHSYPLKLVTKIMTGRDSFPMQEYRKFIAPRTRAPKPQPVAQEKSAPVSKKPPQESAPPVQQAPERAIQPHTTSLSQKFQQSEAGFVRKVLPLVEITGKNILPLARFCLSQGDKQPLLTIEGPNAQSYCGVTISATDEENITFAVDGKEHCCPVKQVTKISALRRSFPMKEYLKFTGQREQAPTASALGFFS